MTTPFQTCKNRLMAGENLTVAMTAGEYELSYAPIDQGTFLRSQFPGATRVVSPAHEPLYEREEYQAFLGSLGFAPIENAKSWGKSLTQEKPEE